MRKLTHKDNIIETVKLYGKPLSAREISDFTDIRYETVGGRLKELTDDQSSGINRERVNGKFVYHYAETIDDPNYDPHERMYDKIAVEDALVGLETRLAMLSDLHDATKSKKLKNEIVRLINMSFKETSRSLTDYFGEA